MNIEDRIQFQRETLTRLLGWIAAAETRTGIIIALATAMLGVLAAVAPSRDSWCAIDIVLTSAAALPLLLSLLFLSFASFPRTSGPKGSLLFFGGIAGRDIDCYKADVERLSPDRYLEDLTSQCHRNAEIAHTKFRWIRNSMLLLYISIPPWALAVLSMYRAHA